MNQEYYRNMATTPQFAPDRISRIDGKSAVIDDSQDISVLKHYEETLRTNQRLMQDTINMRDEGTRRL